MFLSGFSTRFWAAACGAAVLLLASLPPACAQKAASKTADKATDKDKAAEKDFIQNTFVGTADQWNIALTYYRSKRREAPVVVLLHSVGGSRLAWIGIDGFAKQLWDKGYAVIAVDLRGHGESKPANAALSAGAKTRQGGAPILKPIDYQLMVTQDLEAVKQYIFEEHQRENLNMRKTAIVAPVESAPLALNFAMIDWFKRPYNDAPVASAQTPRGQDVRALVLVSPEENVPGLNSNNAIVNLRRPDWGIAFFIAYGTRDKRDRGQSQKILNKLTTIEANKDRIVLGEYATNLRGTDLFRQGLHLEADILDFLDKHLAQLPDAWRNRKSILTE
jgi:hypothetical protein